MSSEGKVQVLVRSKKIPVASVLRTEPVYSPSGLLVGSKPVRMVLYGTKLDDEQHRAIEQGQKVSRSLGLDLEVVDVSKIGFLGRLRSSLGAGGSGPRVVVSPPTSSADECVAEPMVRLR